MLLSILCKSANCTGPDEEVTSPANSVARFCPTKFPALKTRKSKDCTKNFNLILTKKNLNNKSLRDYLKQNKDITLKWNYTVTGRRKKLSKMPTAHFRP